MNDSMCYAVKLKESDETYMEGNPLKRSLQMISGDETIETMTAFVKYVVLYDLLITLNGVVKRDPSTDIILFIFNRDDDFNNYISNQSQELEWLFKDIRIPILDSDIYDILQKDSLTEFLFGSNHVRDVINTIGTFNIFDAPIKFTQEYIMTHGESNFRKWYTDKNKKDISTDSVRYIMEIGISFIADLKRYNANDTYTYPIEFVPDCLNEESYLECFCSYCSTMLLSLHPDDNNSSDIANVPVNILKRENEYFKAYYSGSNMLRWCRLMDYSISTNPWSIRYLFSKYIGKRVEKDIVEEMEKGYSKGKILSELTLQIIIIINYFISLHDEVGIIGIYVLNEVMKEVITKIGIKIDKIYGNTSRGMKESDL